MVFCVLAFMGAYLAVAGVKYLLKNKKEHKTSYQKQNVDWLQLTLTGLMLISAFAFEHEAALSINEKLLAVFLPVIIKISL
jgi:hypothetical protein